MDIQPFQHQAIQRVFPTYNREKSHIVWEFGNEVSMSFAVRIHRKGRYLFEISGSEYKSHKKTA